MIRMRADRESERWVEQLRRGHPRRDQAVATLYEVLLRVAFHELSRRRGQLGSIRGPELDDLAQQAADDALLNILARLDDFERPAAWTEQVGKPMHAIRIETNAYVIDLVCHDLLVTLIAVGDPLTDELRPRQGQNAGATASARRQRRRRSARAVRSWACRSAVR
jgi:hypothetical protein